MYLQSHLEATVFTYELIFINFLIPAFVMCSLVYTEYSFSGSPVRAAVYSQKMKALHIAILIWSVARVLRAIGGIYEDKLFYGMILGLSN